MSEVPYALATTAGMLAAFNPCGFALLPAYLSLLVTDEDGSRLSAVGRALLLTAAMTCGFVAVFGMFGLVVAPLALSVEQYLPWATVLIGIVLVGLGGWLLSGRELYLSSGPKLRTGAPTRSWASMALYGVSYAVASLSCTIGPFLALTTSTFRSSSVGAGIGVFLAYAAGMGVVVGVLAVAVAMARTSLVTRLRRARAYVSRVSGALLLLAGGYVAYYGVYELRVFSGGSAEDPLVGTATEWQGRLVTWLDRVGVVPVAGALAALVAVGLLVGWLRTRRSSGMT